MSVELVSPNQAASRIVEAFGHESRCRVAVQEERAFEEDKWLDLGTISLPPKPRGISVGTDGPLEAITTSTAFEWQLPDAEGVASEAASLLGVAEGEDDYAKVSRILDQAASIAVRVGLLHPQFDPAAIEEMPFRRATTVVSDTSGVLQGGLDFVVSYLQPRARVKIPAIVQMEFVNFTDRFFKTRRTNQERRYRNRHTKGGHKAVHRADELMEHLKSQGGQRALLRFELQTDAEIERTYLLGDPLRDAFQREGGTLRELNISVPVSAYVDRLILEAARSHQAQSEPGHAVRLLTSDQGLTLMALAEGVKPIYFKAVKRTDFFGELFTGQIFHPFTGEMQGIPLTSVLWELASSFGAARLKWEDGRTISIFSLGDAMAWSLFHSVDDLLWFSTSAAVNGGAPANSSAAPITEKTEVEDTSQHASATSPIVSFQRMNIDRLFRLVCTLDDRQVLDAAEASAVLNVRPRSTGDYRRFLTSAGLLEMEDGRWKALAPLRDLSAALRNSDAVEFRKTLLRAPSFAAFLSQVGRSPVGQAVELSNLLRVATTYRTLGELALICASVGNCVYPTPEQPSSGAFAEIALRRFSELDRGHGLVATGRWLESLIQHDGIHPEFARLSLEQAHEEGLLRRSTEGSTMQTGFDNHVVHVLGTDAGGSPIAMLVRLYRGDYLIPRKASVSLRIEAP